MPFFTRKNKKPLGIYVHVPFCRSKCQYCDFYSVTDRDPKLMDQYRLAICEHIPTHALEGRMFVGELSLDGTLQPIHGMLPIALCAKEQGLKEIIVPKDNALEAAVVEGNKEIIDARIAQIKKNIEDTKNGIQSKEDTLSLCLKITIDDDALERYNRELDKLRILI